LAGLSASGAWRGDGEEARVVRVGGAGDGRWLVTHLAQYPSAIVVKMSLNIGFAILTVTALGFIAIAVKAPTAVWRLLLAVALSNLPDYWRTAMFPAELICR
jgi:peptide/nickel transport system permease protein